MLFYESLFSSLNDSYVYFSLQGIYNNSKGGKSMDQVKIGKFIAKCRKEKNMTQAELAEKLNITDRAISKWETGKGMPDSSIMLDLCNELNITVNELLSGEMIKMENYDKMAEENFIKLQKEKEDSDKRLLFSETIIGTIITVSFLLMIFLSIFAIENIIWKVTTMVIGIVIFIIGTGFCLLIEQRAGYYQCDKCKYKYIPSYKQVLFAMHSGRTRYMRCPKCHKKTWNKKVID